MTITSITRHPSEAEYNKRIASVRFAVNKNYYGCWELSVYPVSFGSIHVTRNHQKAKAVWEFLEAMPLIELDSFLRAKDARYGKWLDTGETL